MKKYRLLIGATPSNVYSGGYLAGKVLPHWHHAYEYKKVFWVCPMSPAGLDFGRIKNGKETDEWKKMRESVSNHGIFSVGNGKISIADKGYFYESESGLSWQFDLEAIRKRDELSDDEISTFAPPFRKEYLKPGREHMEWILLKNLKKLKNPISLPYAEFLVCGKPLTPSHFRYNTVFVVDNSQSAPAVEEKLELRDEVDRLLKDFLREGSPAGRLKEYVVHEAFLLLLMEMGWYVENEGFLLIEDKEDQRFGRFDVLFKNAQGEMIAVELKRKRDEDAVTQLEGYMKSLRKEYPDLKNGVVICDRKTKVLEENALNSKFDLKIIEYHINIDIDLKGKFV